MSAKIKIGCKECGGVIEVERSTFSSSVSLKIKNDDFKEKFGTLIVQCKNRDEKRKTTCGTEIDADFIVSNA